VKTYTIEEYVISSLKKNGIKIEDYDPKNIEKIEINTFKETKVKLKKIRG